MKKWVWQQQGYELGNFVMMTPAIRLLSEKEGYAIPVLFDTTSVESLYVKCPFIKILGKRPTRNPIMASKPPHHASGENVKIFMKQCRVSGNPETYVDPPEPFGLNVPKPVAVFHGCLGKHWLQYKRLPRVTLQYLVDALVAKGFTPVVLGAKQDNQFWQKINLPDVAVNLVGKLPLKKSVDALAECLFFISNDTGLYHVAGALKKPGLVLWHRTPFVRNKAPYEGIMHCVSKEKSADKYASAIDGFVKNHGNS